MLNKQLLKQNIKRAIQNSYPENSEDNNNFAEKLSSDLADAIDTYIRAAQVVPGQAVTGTAGAFPVAATTVTPGTLQ